MSKLVIALISVLGSLIVGMVVFFIRRWYNQSDERADEIQSIKSRLNDAENRMNSIENEMNSIQDKLDSLDDKQTDLKEELEIRFTELKEQQVRAVNDIEWIRKHLEDKDE